MNDLDATTSDEFRKAALALIASESTLTLSTFGRSGPWSAPVYHVFFHGGFYFFSSPDSRHIRQAMAGGGKAAASLFHRADDWKDIRGIQMSGTVQPSQSMKVIAAYLSRFPFTLSFFPEKRKPDLNAFWGRFKVRLYGFMPTEIHYVDNRFGFGTRRRIDQDASLS